MGACRGSGTGTQETVDLRVYQGGDEVAKIELSAAPVVFGRAEDCDVCVDDATVAPRHLRLFQSAGDVFAEDVGGAGTFVNGIPAVGVVRLNSGDRIGLGSFLFEVRFAGRVNGMPATPAAKGRSSFLPWFFAAAVTVTAGIVAVVSCIGRGPVRSHTNPCPGAAPAETAAPVNAGLSPADLFSRADAAYDAGLYGEAVVLCRRAAGMGQHDAENLLGTMYRKGRGVPQDFNESVRWFKTAAEAGQPEALFNLGVAYAMGEGLPKDTEQAAAWYRKAADKGLPEAKYNLAVLYIEGDGVPKDVALGLSLLLGIRDKLPAASCKLGVIYYNGQGVECDQVKAAEYFRAGAEGGDAMAQFNLSMLYENGEGVKRDYEAADKWLRSAAGLGSESAMKALKDPRRSFRKAALTQDDVRTFLDGYCEAWCRLSRSRPGEDDQSGYSLLDPVSVYCSGMHVSPWNPSFGINDFEVLGVAEVVNERRRALGFAQSFEFTLRVSLQANSGATMGTRRVKGRLDWSSKSRIGALLLQE